MRNGTHCHRWQWGFWKGWLQERASHEEPRILFSFLTPCLVLVLPHYLCLSVSRVVRFLCFALLFLSFICFILLFQLPVFLLHDFIVHKLDREWLQTLCSSFKFQGETLISTIDRASYPQFWGMAIWTWEGGSFKKVIYGPLRRRCGSGSRMNGGKTFAISGNGIFHWILHKQSKVEERFYFCWCWKYFFLQNF